MSTPISSRLRQLMAEITLLILLLLCEQPGWGQERTPLQETPVRPETIGKVHNQILNHIGKHLSLTPLGEPAIGLSYTVVSEATSSAARWTGVSEDQLRTAVTATRKDVPISKLASKAGMSDTAISLVTRLRKIVATFSEDSLSNFVANLTSAVADLPMRERYWVLGAAEIAQSSYDYWKSDAAARMWSELRKAKRDQSQNFEQRDTFPITVTVKDIPADSLAELDLERSLGGVGALVSCGSWSAGACLLGGMALTGAAGSAMSALTVDIQ